jgi:hypothetical protein
MLDSFIQDINGLFAPMDKKYCNLFYAISFINFFVMILVVINLFFLLTSQKKNMALIVISVSNILILGINYISNRLFFNMCK